MKDKRKTTAGAKFRSIAQRSIAVGVLLLSATSCHDTYSEFCTQYPVSFSCDITFSPFNTVTSMGQFLSVRLKANHTAYIVYNPALDKTTEMAVSEVEARSFAFGLGGLVIGQPYFNDGSSVYYAYDLACPHCDRSSARLTIDAMGQARCSRCDAVFDLNNDGLVVEGEGRPLYRYRISQSTIGTLYVHN